MYHIPAHIKDPAAYERAIQNNIIANARKGRRDRWYATHADAGQLNEWLNGVGEFDDTFDEDSDRWITHPACIGKFSGSFGEMLIDMRNSIDEYGGLTDKQTKIVRDALARKLKWVKESDERKAAAALKDAKSTFVGEIKERRDWNLTIRHVLTFDGQFGLTYFNIMNDDVGNVIVGKGTKRFGAAGDVVSVKATIVKHEDRDGVKQTIINRPKFT